MHPRCSRLLQPALSQPYFQSHLHQTASTSVRCLRMPACSAGQRPSCSRIALTALDCPCIILTDPNGTCTAHSLHAQARNAEASTTSSAGPEDSPKVHPAGKSPPVPPVPPPHCAACAACVDAGAWECMPRATPCGRKNASFHQDASLPAWNRAQPAPRILSAWAARGQGTCQQACRRYMGGDEPLTGPCLCTVLAATYRLGRRAARRARQQHAARRSLPPERRRQAGAWRCVDGTVCRLPASSPQPGSTLSRLFDL